MTEPRADDPAALVAEARAEHHAEALGGPEDMTCEACVDFWPCLAVRLADALEQAQDQVRRRTRAESAALSAERSAWDMCERLKRERDAARSEAAGLRPAVEAQRPNLEALKAATFEVAGYDPYDLGKALGDVVAYALSLEAARAEAARREDVVRAAVAWRKAPVTAVDLGRPTELLCSAVDAYIAAQDTPQ